MSNYICKQRKSLFIFKRALLSKIIVRSKEMSICENCFKCSFRFCVVSPLDSIQCVEYICSNRSKYNILNFTIIQLETLFSIYVRLETELENAFERQI